MLASMSSSTKVKNVFFTVSILSKDDGHSCLSAPSADIGTETWSYKIRRGGGVWNEVVSGRKRKECCPALTYWRPGWGVFKMTHPSKPQSMAVAGTRRG